MIWEVILGSDWETELIKEERIWQLTFTSSGTKLIFISITKKGHMKITFETLKIIFITGKFWFSRVISFQNILRIGCFQVFAST